MDRAPREPARHANAPATVVGGESAHEMNVPNNAIDSIESGVVGRGPRTERGGASRSASAPESGATVAATSPIQWRDWILPLTMLAGGAVICMFIRRKRGTARASGPDAVEILSRTVVSPKQSLCLVRLGRGVLLVGVSPESMVTLADVRDELDVATLLGRVEQGRSNSSTANFEAMLTSAARRFEGDETHEATVADRDRSFDEQPFDPAEAAEAADAGSPSVRRLMRQVRDYSTRAAG